jgi:hypothetical protein
MGQDSVAIAMLTLAAAALAAACAAGGPVSAPEEGMELPFEPVLQLNASGLVEPAHEVVRDEARWAEVWARINERVSPAPSPPPVDFTRSMLLIAAAGTRATGGYGIAIRSVRLRDGTLEVDVVESCPPPGAMVVMMLTSPVEVVRLERRAEQVVFRKVGEPSCR